MLITLPTVTDEEVDSFLAKVNEKYELEYTKEDLDIITMPSMNFNEIIKPYLTPVLLTIVLSIIYIAVRYRKLGVAKIIAKPIIAIVVTELLILSAYLIVNLPIDVSIIPVTLIGLGIAFIYTVIDNNRLLEKRMKELAEQEENK